MKAVRFVGRGDVRFDDVAREPSSPRSHELLVAPVLAGLCGTDMKRYTGRVTPQSGVDQVLGHEFVAKVVEVGDSITGFDPGDFVAVMPMFRCMRCYHCVRGAYELCNERKWIGLNSDGGGLAELCMLQDYQAFPLGLMTEIQGAVLEPAAVALNSVLRVGVAAGDSVLVVGFGPIGALVALACMAMGAGKVFVVEPNRARASAAVQLGAVLVAANDRAGLISEIQDMTDGLGFDLAFDSAGVADSLDLCISAVKPGARVGVPATHTVKVDLDAERVTNAAISIVGSTCYSMSTWHGAMRLASTGRFPIERTVTTCVPFEEVLTGGFEALTNPQNGQLKVLVQVNETVADQASAHSTTTPKLGEDQ